MVIVDIVELGVRLLYLDLILCQLMKRRYRASGMEDFEGAFQFLSVAYEVSSKIIEITNISNVTSCWDCSKRHMKY